VIESGDFCWKTIEERNFEATTAHPYMMDVCFANEWRERYHLSLSEYLGEISARQSSTSTQGLDGQVVHLLALAILQHANNHGENRENKQLEKERSM
jgi:hypothetical protein